MEILLLFIGLAAGAIIGYLAARLVQKNQNTSDASLQMEKTRLEERIHWMELEHQKMQNIWDDQLKKRDDDLLQERKKLFEMQAQLSKLEEANRNLEEKIRNDKAELEQLQQKFKTEFEVLANKILEDKSNRFAEQNKANLDIIINPLREKISSFEKQVQETYDKELRDKLNLQNEIKRLIELNQQVSEQANNLAHALKGDTKTQGNWGELVLEKVLERSGLKKDIEYRTQVSGTYEEGGRVQPDVVVFLPDDKHIIIDSKVSLVAYERMVNAESEEERQKFARAHVDSVKNHIKQLGEKDYTQITQLHTPDFVLMFMPIEAAFSAAMQQDPELFNIAWDKKIVLVSPTTLLATLRTVASMWKQERQVQNALEIAKSAGDMVDKLVGFTEDMIEVGNFMDKSKKRYEDAMNKLSTGKGNLIRRAEYLRELGAKAEKRFNQALINKSNEQLED
ncbi:MAG: DNA recombination protein RmuC [Flavobacteriales bacterium]|nr:DNA recombination protein RmuC [Flavobacteriales bacterium]